MLPETTLFIELMTAKTAGDIDGALEAYTETTGKVVTDAFIGNNDNNCGMIEVMTNSYDALYERIMNGFDAGIEHYDRQGLFKSTSISSPAQAMQKIFNQQLNNNKVQSSDDFDEEDFDIDEDDVVVTNGKSKFNPFVFVINTEANRTKTVTVADTTIGIHGVDFPKTILSLAGKNKISNPLLCGRYNMGGSATFNFSERTIIASIPETNTETVYFTVVNPIMQVDWKAPSYVYKVVSSSVFSCPVADIPAHLIRRPQDINNDNLASEAYYMLYLPEHGTVIRHVQYDLPQNIVNVYNFFRDAGFGIPLPVRFLNGFGKSKKKLYNIRGLRHVLNDPKMVNNRRYPLKHHATPISTPFMIGGSGSISVEYWLMDVIHDPNSTKPAKKPTEALTQHKERGIFVTLNGQTHSRLPTKVLLRKEFPAIDQHIIIEVNCDGLDAFQRGKFFASNRQNIKSGMEDEIAKLILNILRADVNVKNFNDDLANRARNQASLDFNQITSFIQKYLKNPLAGLTNSIFGHTVPSSAAGNQHTPTKNQNGGNGSGGSSSTAAVIIERDPPTYVRVSGNEILNHQDVQWIKVVTDAPGKYTDDMIVHLPPFLSEVTVGTSSSRNAFKRGHGAFQVMLAPNTPVGTSGDISVEIPIGNGASIVSAPRIFTVTAVQVTKPKSQTKVSPDLVPIFVSPTDPNWSNIEAGNVPVSEVAFRFEYLESNHLLNIWINSEFRPYVHMCQGLAKYGSAAVERFKCEYTCNLSTTALPWIEKEIDDAKTQVISGTNEHTLHHIRSSFAQGILSYLAIQIESACKSGKLNDDDDAAELETLLSMPYDLPKMVKTALEEKIDQAMSESHA